jgi:hypothetical protein
MKIINQYSLLWGAAILLAILAIILFRDGAKNLDYVILAGAAIIIAVIWLIARPKATPLDGISSTQSQIGAGTPVLLEFQSPY